MALSNNPNQAEVVKTIKDLESNKQNNLPTTSTAGKVLKSTSTAGTVEWGDVSGGGTATDVQIDSTSITSSNVANIKTINANYNSSSNKLATASDLITYTQDSIGTAINPLSDYYNKSSVDSMLDQKAGTSASNLTSSNVTSWKNKLNVGMTRIYNSSSGVNSGSVNLGNVSDYAFLIFCMAQSGGSYKQQCLFVRETLTNGSIIGLYGYDTNYINATVSGSPTSMTISLDGYNNLKLFSVYGIKL